MNCTYKYTNLVVSTDPHPSEFIIAIESFIKDKLWINRSDTFKIYPKLNISKESCTTYDYYNYQLSQLKKNKSNEDLDLYKRIAKNTNCNIPLSFDCPTCTKEILFTEVEDALIFSPPLKMESGSYVMFAYENTGDWERGFHFTLEKDKDNNSIFVKDFFCVMECIWFRIGEDHIEKLNK